MTSDNFQQLVTLVLSQGTNDPEIIEDAVPIALLSSNYPTAQLELLLVHPMNARKVPNNIEHICELLLNFNMVGSIGPIFCGHCQIGK
jgi:hypothetical protein